MAEQPRTPPQQPNDPQRAAPGQQQKQGAQPQTESHPAKVEPAKGEPAQKVEQSSDAKR